MKEIGFISTGVKYFLLSQKSVCGKENKINQTCNGLSGRMICHAFWNWIESKKSSISLISIPKPTQYFLVSGLFIRKKEASKKETIEEVKKEKMWKIKINTGIL